MHSPLLLRPRTVLALPQAVFIGMWLAGSLSGTGLFFLSVVGVGCLIGLGVMIGGDARFDPNANRYESMLSLITGFKDDWRWEDVEYDYGTKKRPDVVKVGVDYMLHDSITIRRGTYTSPSEHRRSTAGEIRITVKDPVSGEAVRYVPEKEYNGLFRAALDVLHEYRELKSLVNVALDAQEKSSPVDVAREALEDFRARHPNPSPAA
jgi:hypothetical protein